MKTVRQINSMIERLKFSIQNKAVFLFLFVAFVCGISYIIGGSAVIVEIVNRHMIYKLGIGSFILVTAFVLTCFCFIKYNLSQKISNFSWKIYCEEFRKRYHCNKVDIMILIGMLFIGGILRIVGYNWGITSIFQPDEGKLVNPAVRMALEQSIYQKSSFYYPDQFLSKFAALFIYIYGKCTDIELDISVMPQAFFIFRIIVIVTGIATIFTAFLIGNYFKKHLGAVLVSLFPSYISLAKQVTGDVSALFFLSLTMLFSMRYMENKKKRFLVLMAMGAAMATLEKWHGAVGIGYAGFVVLLNSRRIKEAVYNGIYTLAAYFGWILLLSPNMIFHLKSAIVDGFINIAVYNGSKGAPYYQQFLKYCKFGVQHYGGIVYILILVIGLITIFYSFKRQYMVLGMGILKVLILCFLNRAFVRWGLELYFCELLIAAFGIDRLINFKIRRGQIAGYGIAAILTMDFFSGSMVYAMTAAHSCNDTRLLQQEECLQNGITPYNSVSAYYTGFIPGGWSNSVVGSIPYQTFADSFVLQDGKLYRISEAAHYAIINVSDIREKELEAAISQNCPIIFSYDSMYNDIFWDPLNSIGIFWNDAKLVYENVKASIHILNGALIGRDIEIYDTTGVPFLSAGDGM